MIPEAETPDMSAVSLVTTAINQQYFPTEGGSTASAAAAFQMTPSRRSLTRAEIIARAVFGGSISRRVELCMGHFQDERLAPFLVSVSIADENSSNLFSRLKICAFNVYCARSKYCIKLLHIWCSRFLRQALSPKKIYVLQKRNVYVCVACARKRERFQHRKIRRLRFVKSYYTFRDKYGIVIFVSLSFYQEVFSYMLFFETLSNNLRVSQNVNITHWNFFRSARSCSSLNVYSHRAPIKIQFFLKKIATTLQLEIERISVNRRYYHLRPRNSNTSEGYSYSELILYSAFLRIGLLEIIRQGNLSESTV